ncbi:MAG: acetate--CoA ligase family protein [Geodermatophilaceae bacterium]
MLTGLNAVFNPRRIALVGASDRPGTMGRLLWDNLKDFPGEVVPISRSANIDGTTAYADLADAPGQIDLVVVGVPAERVLDTIRSAAAKRVRAAVVLSAGFAEIGADGGRLQDEVVAAARAGGVRLVGPNCFGVQNCDLPLNASIAPGAPKGDDRGGISLVTQSGSYGMAVHALGLDEAMPFAKVYAAGNKSEISDAETLAYLRQDPATRVICLLLESITDPREFFAEACRTTAVKPVIAAVTGRSAAGKRAAVSHTAALASDTAIRDAALAQAGVVRASSGLAMLDAAKLLSAQPLPPGGRVGIVTNSGGLGVELTDLLDIEGLDVPELSPALQERLRELLPSYGSPRNPVDMTPIWSRYAELYPALVDVLARSGEVDIVIPILLARGGSADVVDGLAATVSALREDGNAVPVYGCWVTERLRQPQADALQAAGVPCLPWPERTAAAAGVARRCAAVLGRDVPVRRSRPVPPLAPDADLSDPVQAQEFLAAAGIEVVAATVCTSPEDAVAAARQCGYPAVLKVVHPDLSHKSDVAGVRIGLPDSAAVQRAAQELLGLRPGARVLVQPQASGVEFVVGGVRDPAFGPVLMVGVGGTAVEVLGDVQFAVAPIDVEHAERMLRALRGAALLDGVRGASPVDVAALSALIVAVGDLLVGVPEIAEMDLNPVLATASGVLPVDWRIVTSST